HYTYPIVYAMQEARLPLESPPNPDSLMGMMLLTGSLERIIQDCLARLEECRIKADALGLPGWSAYCQSYATVLLELRGLLSLKTSAENLELPPHPYRNRFRQPVDYLGRMITRAEIYLLADPTFHESWEFQRLSMSGASELIQRAFVINNILICLCPYAPSLSAQVTQMCEILGQGNFCYYEDYSSLPDIDDLGLALQLFRYSDRLESHRALIERILPIVKLNLLPSGEMPAFLTVGCEAQMLPHLWTNRSAAVTLNLLLGLIEYDFSGQQSLIETIADAQYARFIHRGIGPLGYYRAPYTLWLGMKTLQSLREHPIGPTLKATLDRAEPVLLARIEREKSVPLTSQNAAMLTLACLETSAEPLFEKAWITCLLKNQRYDGSWDDEPHHFTLHQSEQSFWYSSRLVTTGFCYLALQSYRRFQTGKSNG
ncbi:MAG: hypothetical protein WA821_11485, partial [Anaerolineales bacterium]